MSHDNDDIYGSSASVPGVLAAASSIPRERWSSQHPDEGRYQPHHYQQQYARVERGIVEYGDAYASVQPQRSNRWVLADPPADVRDAPLTAQQLADINRGTDNARREFARSRSRAPSRAPSRSRARSVAPERSRVWRGPLNDSRSVQLGGREREVRSRSRARSPPKTNSNSNKRKADDDDNTSSSGRGDKRMRLENGDGKVIDLPRSKQPTLANLTDEHKKQFAALGRIHFQDRKTQRLYEKYRVRFDVDGLVASVEEGRRVESMHELVRWAAMSNCANKLATANSGSWQSSSSSSSASSAKLQYKTHHFARAVDLCIRAGKDGTTCVYDMETTWKVLQATNGESNNSSKTALVMLMANTVATDAFFRLVSKGPDQWGDEFQLVAADGVSAAAATNVSPPAKKEATPKTAPPPPSAATAVTVPPISIPSSPLQRTSHVGSSGSIIVTNGVTGADEEDGENENC